MRDCPQSRVDLKSVDLGAEMLIYDEHNGRVHILNSTAKRIWELCDGTRDSKEIVDEINRLFPGVAVEQIRSDVERSLELLNEKNVIVWTVQPAPKD